MATSGAGVVESVDTPPAEETTQLPSPIPQDVLDISAAAVFADYGIDVGRSEVLIAANVSVEELASSLGDQTSPASADQARDDGATWLYVITGDAVVPEHPPGVEPPNGVAAFVLLDSDGAELASGTLQDMTLINRITDGYEVARRQLAAS